MWFPGYVTAFTNCRFHPQKRGCSGGGNDCLWTDNNLDGFFSTWEVENEEWKHPSFSCSGNHEIQSERKNKTVFLENCRVSLYLLTCIDWVVDGYTWGISVWGEEHALHHLWHLVLWRNPFRCSPCTSVWFSVLGASPMSSLPVWKDFRHGRVDRLSWSWGLDSQRLWQGSRSHLIIRPLPRCARRGRRVAGSWCAPTAGEEIVTQIVTGGGRRVGGCWAFFNL